MTTLLQDAASSLASQTIGGLLEHANQPVHEERDLQKALNLRIANYIAALRDAKMLPRHAFASGFFTDTFPVIAIDAPQDPSLPPRAPVAPISQTASLLNPDEPSIRMETLPDRGRRLQIWWHELSPDEPSVRGEDIVQIARRVEWLGEIERMDDEGFTAILWDRARPGTAERGRFSYRQLSRRDRDGVSQGRFFYWTVGYADTAAGDRTAFSRLRLRRRSRGADPADVRRETDHAVSAILDALDVNPET